MAAEIDKKNCIGCGLCPSICPEIFEMGDDGQAITIGNISPTNYEDFSEALDSCPVGAISES